jgi:hypothetical protein
MPGKIAEMTDPRPNLGRRRVELDGFRHFFLLASGGRQGRGGQQTYGQKIPSHSILPVFVLRGEPPLTSGSLERVVFGIESILAEKNSKIL